MNRQHNNSDDIRGMLLRLSPGDNVLVATGLLVPGLAAVNGGGQIELVDTVTLGHKIAARPIAAGQAIIKHGVPIGVATCDIAAGMHVHVHNIRSNYTPTHRLDETADGGNHV